MCIVHMPYITGDLGKTYDVHLGLTGKPAPAPVGPAPLIKSGPQSEGWPIIINVLQQKK